jgi:hypothetical protein
MKGCPGVVKRPGRPPLDQTSRTPSAAVHLKLPASVYDTADKLAKQGRESIQDVIRRGLKRLLLDERGI